VAGAVFRRGVDECHAEIEGAMNLSIAAPQSVSPQAGGRT